MWGSVDMTEKIGINDDLSMLCEHGDIEEMWRESKFGNVKGQKKFFTGYYSSKSQ